MKARHSHITIAAGSHFKARCLHITVALGGLFEITVLSHYAVSFRGPFNEV